MMKHLFALVLILCVQAVAQADLKVTTKNTAAGRSTDSTIYIKGQRQRTESANQTSIYQCDLKRMIQVNDRSRKYMISHLDQSDGTPATENVTTPQPAARPRRGGVVTYTITTVDTGERRQMFGYTARHIKTVTVIYAPEGTCNPGRSEMETDGWYIDLQFILNCSEDRPTVAPPQPTVADCRDEIRYRRVGAGRLGFPVLLTTKMKLAGMEAPEDAEEAAMMERMMAAMTTMMEVTDISQATLDAARFNVPAGYTEVNNLQELYGTGGAPSTEGVSSGNLPLFTWLPKIGELIGGHHISPCTGVLISTEHGTLLFREPCGNKNLLTLTKFKTTSRKETG